MYGASNSQAVAGMIDPVKRPPAGGILGAQASGPKMPRNGW